MRGESLSGGQAVLESRNSEWEVFSFLEQADYFPFRVRGGDVDNDGRDEIVVGVFRPSKTGRDGYMMDVHVFEPQPGVFHAKWLTESRPFADLDLVELGGRWMVIFLRQLHDESRVDLLSWNGFNFWVEERFAFLGNVSLSRVDGMPAISSPEGRRVQLVKSALGYGLIPDGGTP